MSPSFLFRAFFSLVIVTTFACSSDKGAGESETPSTQGELVEFRTADDLRIVANFLAAESGGDSPAVVLIHQGGSSKAEWSAFADRLAKEGIASLAYDVRGHGESDPVPEIRELFNDPNKAPEDLRAALEYLRSHADVDAGRIGVVGASIGSNLACVASSQYGIQTAIAMSGKTSAVKNLAGTEELHLRSVYHISSEKDGSGDRAKWARELFEETAEPRELTIAPGGRHGVYIFEDDPTLPDKMVAWLKKTL